MNYDHSYHAGSFTDVFKHIVLMQLIQKLQQKDSAYCYLDTHAGYPFYDLQEEKAARSLESVSGIQLLWQQKNLIQPIQDYLKLLNRFNEKSDAQRRYYPGSSAIVAMLKRSTDDMILTELQDKPYAALKRYYHHDKTIACHHQDGYQALKSILPPKAKRGLVLIDPPFEDKNEYEHIVTALKQTLARWPNGIYAIWYPVKSEKVVDHFVKMIKQRVTDNCMDFRCCPWPSDVAQRLAGSGMLLINPPWQIDETINTVADELETIFKVT